MSLIHNANYFARYGFHLAKAEAHAKHGRPPSSIYLYKRAALGDLQIIIPLPLLCPITSEANWVKMFCLNATK